MCLRPADSFARPAISSSLFSFDTEVPDILTSRALHPFFACAPTEVIT